MGKEKIGRLLASELITGDINACCGVLRRIFSETVDDNSIYQLQNNVKDILNDIISLGKVSLSDNASLVRPTSIAVLCHTSQRLGDWKSAIHFSESLPNSPSPSFISSLLSPENCNFIIKYCEKKNWPLDVPHATKVLTEKYGNWLSALEVAKSMERQYQMGEWYSLGVLIPHLAASGSWEKAVELFNSGIAQGSLVDPKFVASLIHRTAKLKQWQTSLYMLSIIEKTKESSNFYPSDIEFFKDIISISPNWKSSLSIFNIAVSLGIKPDTYMVSLLLGQCEEAHEWLVATKVYDMAVSEGFISSIIGDSYQTLVRSFHAVKQWEKALSALSWMSKADEASAATGMSELLELCEKSGEWEAAIKVGNILMEKNSYLPVPTRLSFLFACAKGAVWETAIKVLQESFTDTSQSPHPLFICAAMQACVAANKWKETIMLLQQSKKEEPRVILPPLAYRLAIKSCVGSGRWLEAVSLLEDMRIYGLPRDNHTQRLSLWAAALSGNWELSLKHLNQLPLTHRTPQDRMLVRSSTKNLSATAKAIALKYLQQQKN